MKYNYRSIIKTFWQASDRYLRYQLITKFIVSLLLIPAFGLATRELMYAQGRSILSHSNMARFLLSTQGIIFSLLAIGLIFLSLLIEIGGFILISSRQLNHQASPGWRKLLKASLAALPRFIGPGGLLLLIYSVLFLPLTGLGPIGSLSSKIKIPPFIMDTIRGHGTYYIIYIVLLVLFGLFSLRWIFTFHFILLGRMSSSQAIKASSQLVWGQKWRFLRGFLGLSLILLLIAGLVTVVWLSLVYGLIEVLELNDQLHQSVLLFAYLLQYWALGLFSLILVPFQVHHLTALFYRLVERDERFNQRAWQLPDVTVKPGGWLNRLLRSKLVFVLGSLLIIGLFSLPFGYLVQYLKQPYHPIDIIAHRAGGFEAPENSLAGLRHAYDLGITQAEIDVQRTADGHYILVHDNDFARVAGDPRKVRDLTLSEARQIDIGKPFGPDFAGEKVPTLEEVLQFAKNKMQLFIELKGPSADHKMAADVIALVKQNDMLDEVVIVSLDVELIQHIEEKYDVDTGLIYFAGIGEIDLLKGNYLILEENLASEFRLEAIQMNFKKAVVWTINSPEAIQKMVRSRADAIITDELSQVQAAIEERDRQSDRERLFDVFLKVGNR